jgi:hypothetical protein
MYFAIPTQGGSSQLNLQMGIDGSVPLDIFSVGLSTRLVAISLTGDPQATLGFEPFGKVRFGQGFARLGFSIYPAYSNALGFTFADGVVWGLGFGLGFET